MTTNKNVIYINTNYDTVQAPELYFFKTNDKKNNVLAIPSHHEYTISSFSVLSANLSQSNYTNHFRFLSLVTFTFDDYFIIY